MSDFPYVGPPPGGLHDAMSAARRRRLRSATTTSGLSAVSLLLVAVLVGQTGRTTLVQGPTKETPAVTTDNRTVTKDRQTTAKVDAGGTSTVAVGGPSTTASTNKAPAGLAAPAVPSRTRTTGGTHQQPLAPLPRSAPYAAGPVTRTEGVLSATPCAVGSDAPSSTDCLSSYVVTGPSNAPYEFGADICSNDPNPVFLHYAGTSEIDFTVVDPKGNELWRWSRWHPLGPTAHTLRVDTGYCTQWTFDWTGVDANGKALPHGNGYRLRVHFLADELAHRTVPDQTITLS